MGDEAQGVAVPAETSPVADQDGLREVGVCEVARLSWATRPLVGEPLARGSQLTSTGPPDIASKAKSTGMGLGSGRNSRLMLPQESTGAARERGKEAISSSVGHLAVGA